MGNVPVEALVNILTNTLTESEEETVGYTFVKVKAKGIFRDATWKSNRWKLGTLGDTLRNVET